MTRVDFYVLKDASEKAGPMFTCKLTEKAIKQGHRVFIATESQQQLRQLDDLLWTFRAGSFIPHAVYEHDQEQTEPVLLGHDTEPAGPGDVLINLTGSIPAWFGNFDRVAEVVCGNEQQVAASRERYAFYNKRGYTLNHHSL